MVCAKTEQLDARLRLNGQVQFFSKCVDMKADDINYCTELDWHGGKCMDICPAGITEVMSCDGTATSERWCCGASTDCCSTNVGAVTLKQVFEDKSSTSPASATSILTSFTSASSTSTAVPSQICDFGRGEHENQCLRIKSA